MFLITKNWYELLKNEPDKYKVVILEESEQIGGISQTLRYNGNRMDIGGHRFFSKDKRVTEWWEELMPTQGAPSFDDKLLGREKPLSEHGPDPESDDNVMLVRDRVSRIYYSKHFFDYPVSLKWSTIKGMGFVTTLKAGFSYLKSVFFKKPEDSLENFYINRFGKVLYSMFIEGYTEKLWGRHPSQISADWGAQRVKGLSIMAVIKNAFGKVFGSKNKKVETSLIEQYVYPKYGPGQLWEKAAEEFEKMGGKILKGCKVISVEAEGNTVKSVTYVKDGKEYKGPADIYISSMPVKDLICSFKNADFSEKVLTAAKELPYRDFVTVGLLVPKLNLKNETDIKTLGNIVPDCWIYVQDTGVKLGRIQIFNNWSPYMVKDPENTVWIGLEYFCEEGDEFWSMSDEDAVEFATKELVKMGVIDADSVIDSHRERVKKAYPAYFDTYDRIDELVDYLNTFENLYCVGRNGQHRYNNMDHSMVTSFETVSNILSGKKTKENIWSVNTEAEYHEENSDENKN